MMSMSRKPRFAARAGLAGKFFVHIAVADRNLCFCVLDIRDSLADFTLPFRGFFLTERIIESCSVIVRDNHQAITANHEMVIDYLYRHARLTFEKKQVSVTHYTPQL